MAPGRNSLETYLRQIVEQAPSVVWIATAGMDEILYVSRAVEDEIGVSREELYDDPTAYIQRVHPDDTDDQLELVAEMASWAHSDDAPEQFVDEYRVYDTDDQLRWVSDTTFPIYEDGEVTRWGGIVTDITERKDYERQLQRQRDSLDILNQMVRHDIRNDLQVVLTYAELLDKDRGDHARNVEMIQRSAQNAVDLTTSARDLAETMLEGDRDPEPVELRPVLRRLVEGIGVTHEEASVAVDGDLPVVSVLADDMLASVFRNLMTNAINHNDADRPEVTISVDDGDERVTIEVADNGPGLPAGREDQIFGRGTKGLASGGTGIGLYLVDRLVENYGGSVTVTDDESTGTTFTVELQRA